MNEIRPYTINVADEEIEKLKEAYERLGAGKMKSELESLKESSKD